jgi:hypothetical protein
MKLLIILLILLVILYITKNKNKKRETYINREEYIDCNRNSEGDFFYKETNILQHLNKINTEFFLDNEFVPNDLIDYNVSNYDDYNLIHQMGNKISNTVLEKEKVKNLMAYNQRIVKKSFNKDNKKLIDNSSMYNCSNYNLTNNFFNNSNINNNQCIELTLLGRYKDNKLHINWNISKNNKIKNINLNYKEKGNDYYNKIEILPNTIISKNYSIGKIEVYNSKGILKYNFFFKEKKLYDVYLEIYLNDGSNFTSNVF